MSRIRSRGFTLTEIMISVVLSIMVFSAMGVLLSRCFSMWVDAQAHWKLAQHARVTRTRILYGAYGIGTGLLNATNVVVVSGSNVWQTITFEPVTAGGNYYRIYGWPHSVKQNIWIEREVGSPRWAWAQEVRYATGSSPLVRANNFSATITNQTVRLNYTLHFSAMGKNFELPQTIEARLVNE